MWLKCQIHEDMCHTQDPGQLLKCQGHTGQSHNPCQCTGGHVSSVTLSFLEGF